jgi:hypothetical protein
MLAKKKIPVQGGNLTTLVHNTAFMLLAGLLFGLLFGPGKQKQYILLKRR